MKNSTYEIYYDEDGDFLEISFNEPEKEGTTEEIEPGIFITKEGQSEIITSIGILNFKGRVGILAKILKKFNMELPLKIDVPN
ncbi:MAG: hypothetical protein KJ905_02965 [Nanoarchaeota archaeon]|nr:hypothetical protein [Nanoarchaeota archaeon]MBU1501710.1 hypothetical protein [Nanoarchaeota archaeon]MBU2459119.1 hypothetical protein [Nanoarchaeota archaeon]